MSQQRTSTQFLSSISIKNTLNFSNICEQGKVANCNSCCYSTECSTPFNGTTFNSDFLLSKLRVLDDNSMPDSSSDLDDSTISNEESGYLYFPGSPVHKFKRMDSKISDLALN